MDERDRYRTSFMMPCGLYEYHRMPFGLTNASANIDRLMQWALP